jgi:hypothetical protein
MAYKTARDRVYEGANILDSRDVINALEEIEREIRGVKDDCEEKWAECEASHEVHKHKTDDDSAIDEQATCVRCTYDTIDAYMQERIGEELDLDNYDKLKAFAEEGAQNISEWSHGEALIAEHYFTAYAEELAEDIGVLKCATEWPSRHIDWEAAAEKLKEDYTELTFGSTTYYARS